MINCITVESVTMWIAVAMIAAFALILPLKKKLISPAQYIAIIVLVFYLSFILSITIVKRTPGGEYQYKLEVFWSYKKAFAGTKELLWENFWNVVLFVPLGMLIPTILKIKKSKQLFLSVIIICAVLSLTIELTQLITKRGLFEFDDIIHNTIGSLLGLIFFISYTKLSLSPALRGIAPRQGCDAPHAKGSEESVRIPSILPSSEARGSHQALELG